MAVPTLSVRYSTDDASDATPAWTDVTSYVRSFSTSRGRESELARVDAGTFEIVLNNRTRQFDPTSNALLRPMNRWSIRATLPNATTEDIILGYAESYEQSWPGVGMDAITVVRGTDEFKVLAQDRLPVTDPPRDTYGALVMYDAPSGYWPMDTVGASTEDPVIGELLTGVNSASSITDTQGAIIGQSPGGYAYLTTTGYWRTDVLAAGQSGDAGLLSELACDGWFAMDTLPSAEENLWFGPVSGGANTWNLNLQTDGKLKFQVRNAVGTTYTVTSTTAMTSGSIPNQVWYHVVGTITGGNLRLYINGTQEASTAFAGVVGAADATGRMFVGNGGATTGAGRTRMFDELAFYRFGLPAARVLAHYTAGTLRGFARGQDPGPRITSVLTSSTSVAATSIRTGTRAMTGSYMTGQPPLEEMRNAERADGVDAVLFIAKNGTVTFLDDGHRSVAPWNAVKATFDDDGTDLPYQEITLDYSDSFIANEWNLTKTGGTTVTTSDATSISRYGKRTQSLTDLPLTTDADVTSASTALLAKYKDPMTRVTGLGLLASGTATFINTIFTLDIGDRIRVFRSPLGGGTRIDQTLFVQKVTVDGDPSGPWRIRLGVSPL